MGLLAVKKIKVEINIIDMIRTVITPTQSNYTVALEFPDDYLGQELELIVFKKQEGLVAEKKKYWHKII